MCGLLTGVQLTPGNWCCWWCFEKSFVAVPHGVSCPPPLLQQEFPRFVLRNGRTVFLEAFNNKEKQIQCIVLEGICTEKKVNENIKVQCLPVLSM